MSRSSDKRLGIRRGGPVKQGERAQQIADAAGPMTAPKPQHTPGPAQGRTPDRDDLIDFDPENTIIGRAYLNQDEYENVYGVDLGDRYLVALSSHNTLLAERDRLREVNAELIAALKDALDALDNDRLAGRYLRPMKRQSVNDQSMHMELAENAMESEKRARAALTRAEVKP